MHLDFEVLELHPRHAFQIAREPNRARRDVWIRLRDETGQEGWGEAAATPFYGESAGTVAAVLPRLAAVLEDAIGSDPFALQRAEEALERALGANPAAKAGISAALHDLFGKRLGAPLWKLWGLDPESAPPSSFTIGIADEAAMREKVREAAGYPILKLKVGTPRDEQILRWVREEAPDCRIRVDANTGWTVKQAIAALPMLQEYGVELLEQPLPKDDLAGARLLRERSPIPVIADESCRTLSDIPALVGAVDGINIKLAKCGSLREAVRMVHCARAHGLSVMLGCMVESTLGIAAAVQLAPMVDYVDLDGAALLATDPFHGPGLEENGTLRFNSEPGLGVARRAAPIA